MLPHLLLWAVYLPLLSFSHASFQSSFFLFSLVFEVVFLSVVDCLPFILFLIIVIICLCLSKNNKSLIKKKTPLVTSVLHTVESQVNIVAAAE